MLLLVVITIISYVVSYVVRKSILPDNVIQHRIDKLKMTTALGIDFYMHS